MKKAILFLISFLIASCISFNVEAQTWFTANQVTVAWNPVTTLSDGTAIPSGDTVKYQLYLRIGTTGDGTPYGAETEAIQQTITFTTEGAYFWGVKTLRYKQGETIPIPSATTSWSNDAGVTDGSPFGIKYYVAPSSAGGLKRVP